MQVYRGMDIGTAKPSPQVREEIAHYMIDVTEPSDAYSVAEFQREGVSAIEELELTGTPVIVAGGSGLHFRALVDPLEFPPTDAVLRTALESADAEALVVELLAADPAAGAHIDLANPRRVVRAVEVLRLTDATPSARRDDVGSRRVRNYVAARPVAAVGFDPGDALWERIETRLDGMIDCGLVAEIRGLADRLGPTARQAVGYKELLFHVGGGQSLQEARVAAMNATAAVARSQRTFFRRDPRITWLPWDDDPDQRSLSVLEAVEELPWTS